MHYTEEQLRQMQGEFVRSFLCRCLDLGLPMDAFRALHYSGSGNTLEWAIDQYRGELKDTP